MAKESETFIYICINYNNMLSIFKAFTKKKPKGFKFSDEDRAKAAAKRKENSLRQTNQQIIEQMQQQLIDRMQMQQIKTMQKQLSIYDDDDDDDDDEDIIEENNGSNALLMSLAAPLLAKLNQPQQDSTPKGVDIASHYIDLSDNEITELIQQVPKMYLKAAKTMDNATIAKLIRAKLPALSEATIEKAIAMVKQ